MGVRSMSSRTLAMASRMIWPWSNSIRLGSASTSITSINFAFAASLPAKGEANSGLKATKATETVLPDRGSRSTSP